MQRRQQGTRIRATRARRALRIPSGRTTRAVLSGLVGAFLVGTTVLATAAAPAEACAHTPRTSSIAGQVLSSFDPIGYATVTVFDARTHRVLGRQVTDGEGDYVITGLPAVRIKVQASKDGFVTDWASHQPNWRTADVYQLLPGQRLTQSWDAAHVLYLDIARTATIGGRVLGAGLPLPHARVTVIEAATGRALRGTIADAHGDYLVTELPPVQVIVRATHRGWYPGYADGTSDRRTATIYTLYPGDVLTGSVAPPVLVLDLVRRHAH